MDYIRYCYGASTDVYLHAQLTIITDIVEVHGDDDSLIKIFRDGTANDTGEGALAYFAKDSSGAIRKSGSISVTTPVFTSSSFYGCMRFNASYTVNGTGYDYLAMRIVGNKGITFFGTSDNDVPPTGYQLLNRGASRNTQKHRFDGGIALGRTGTPTTDSEAAQPFFDENDDKLKLKLPNGSVKEFTLV